MASSSVKQRNVAVAERRAAMGLSQEKLALKVCYESETAGVALPANRSSVIRHVKRIESGEVTDPGGWYKRFISRALRCTSTELFGELVEATPIEGCLAVTSHKFVPAFVGADAVRSLAHSLGLSVAESPTAHSWSGILDHPTGSVELYLFNWGIAVAHIAEPLELPGIAALAKWRVTSYPQNMEWLGQQLSTALGTRIEASYVLSAYWLSRSIWPASALEAAVRLMSMPRVLLGEADPEQAAGAEQCEKALLQNNFDHPGIVPFGVPGTSIGAASWSSVSYHPVVPPRALSPADIVDVELLVQAVWCYARAICDQAEAGNDPAIPNEFGARFLRGMRSRCFTARPQESSAHRSMREAIVQTSGLAEQLDAAMAALREI